MSAKRNSIGGSAAASPSAKNTLFKYFMKSPASAKTTPKTSTGGPSSPAVSKVSAPQTPTSSKVAPSAAKDDGISSIKKCSQILRLCL